MEKDYVSGKNNRMFKIYLWGTGSIAQRLLEDGINAEILGFIQTHRQSEKFRSRPVLEPSELLKRGSQYDLVLVASLYADEIYESCMENQIDLNRVIFLKKGRRTAYIFLPELQNILGEKNFTSYQVQYGIVENSFVDRDAMEYSKLNKRPNFTIRDEYKWPIIYDKYAKAGNMGNYFWQDLWAAKKIIAQRVKEHYDIGSRIDGFVAHLLAAGIAVKTIDIRPLSSSVEGLSVIIDDATMLRQFDNDSVESLSALCSLEHFGLGRYGDPVDPEACFKCFEKIQDKMKKGGDLYISLPVGKERVEFNAHRVFFASTIIDCFDKMELKEYSCAAKGKLEENVEIHKYDTDLHDGEYRYGLFHFVKR